MRKVARIALLALLLLQITNGSYLLVLAQSRFDDGAQQVVTVA